MLAERPYSCFMFTLSQWKVRIGFYCYFPYYISGLGLWNCNIKDIAISKPNFHIQMWPCQWLSRDIENFCIYIQNNFKSSLHCSSSFHMTGHWQEHSEIAHPSSTWLGIGRSIQKLLSGEGCPPIDHKPGALKYPAQKSREHLLN